MAPEIYRLFADNLPLPKGTRIKTTGGGVLTGGTHELSESVLASANRCPNHMSDYCPFWVVGWTDLHDNLIAPLPTAPTPKQAAADLAHDEKTEGYARRNFRTNFKE